MFKNKVCYFDDFVVGIVLFFLVGEDGVLIFLEGVVVVVVVGVCG